MTMLPFPTTENLILWACSAIALLAVVFFRRSVRHRRHKRKQQSARRVLERIKTLPGFPQKINYLRKIDPFVFEELLLEGHCCKVSDEAAFCLIQRPYISKTLLTRRISPRGSP
ncbi:hypothetical protein ACSNM5_26335 [Klebsiella pneumoniae]